MNYKIYCKIGALFTVLLGTLLHFTYDLSGNSDFVAIFSAVNESTWEHLKLIFFPFMLFAVGEYFIYGKKLQNFWASKVVSVLSGMLFITVIFYTYAGIFKESGAVFNIALFIAGVIFAYLLNCFFMKNEYFNKKIINKIAIITAIAFLIMFWVFTFYPPVLNIFKDPVTGGYGI